MATKKKKTTGSKASKPNKTGRKVSAKTGTAKKAPREGVEAKATGAVKAKSAGVPRRPMMEKTFFAKFGQTPEKWRLIDASGATLGRLSTFIAHTLMGKDKPTYTRHADTGDHVVVINAEKIVLTGSKETQKKYYRHSNYPGGLRTETAEEVRSRHPERLVQLAVYRMLPKGHMGRRWFKKLRVFAGPAHPHTAQKPEMVKLPGSFFNSRESA
jgi:large subunit ribosomal protein L13